MINAKIKGNRFEVEMAFRLREIFPDARTSRFMGRLWDDRCGVDIVGTPGWHFQCKAVERLAPGYHEILSAMPKNGNTNAILHKRNNRGIVVVLNFEDFLKLLKKWNYQKKQNK